VDPAGACLKRACADDLFDDICYTANCPVAECFGWRKETTPPPPPPDKCDPACAKGYTCKSNVCVFDETAKWIVRITDGTVSGAVTDFGSDPDPKVCLTVSGVENCTPEASNTTSPVWSAPSGYAFAAMSAATLKTGVSVRYADIDVSFDDPICSGTQRYVAVYR
jgi:hypothetical protein